MSAHFFVVPALDVVAAEASLSACCASEWVLQPVWAVAAPLTPAPLSATQHTLRRVSEQPALNRRMGATLRGEGFHPCRTSLAPCAGRRTESEGQRSPGAYTRPSRCTVLQ